MIVESDVIFFDGRNAYEAAVGQFKNAVVPDVERTRDFAAELDDPKYDDIREKPVVTYCTGGIRCEVLSSRSCRYSNTALRCNCVRAVERNAVTCRCR